MRRIGVGLGLAAAVALSALALGAVADSTADRGRHITVISEDGNGSIAPADFGAAPKQGQQAAATAPVFRRGRRIGRTETVLTVTRVTAEDVTVMIECSTVLPRGAIFFNGSLHLSDLGEGTRVPVVGGTGAYRGAGGQVELQQSSPARTRLSFDLR